MQLVNRVGVLVLAGLFVLAGCGGGDSGGGTSGSNGSWSGTVLQLYVCEGDAYSIDLTVDGTSVTVTGSTSTDIEAGDTGTLSSETGTSKILSMNINGETDIAQWYEDPTGTYAAVVFFDGPIEDNRVGLLQRGGSAPTFVNGDLLGDWAGTSFRVDGALNVVDSSATSVTVSDAGSGIAISGSDGDGAISGTAPVLALGDATLGIWYSNNSVTVGGVTGTHYPLAVLSYDRSVAAVSYMESYCSGSVFSNPQNQKLAIWMRQ